MIEKEHIERLQKIKLVVMDVDGTLTDGGMYYNEAGDYSKKFNVRDGMGVVLLHKAGISTAIMTSENSKIVESRAKKLAIEHLYLGCRNKKNDIEVLAKKCSLELDEIAFIGDDVNDYYAMKNVGFAACPKDANNLIKEISQYICEKNGGEGAFRELAELILLTQGKSINLTESW